MIAVWSTNLSAPNSSRNRPEMKRTTSRPMVVQDMLTRCDRDLRVLSSCFTGNMANGSKPLLIVAAVVLLLRSIRLQSHSRNDLLSKQELAHVLQQVYLKRKDGSISLLVPYRDRLSKVGLALNPISYSYS